MAFSKEGRNKLLSCFFLGDSAPALFLAAYRRNSEIGAPGYSRVPLKDSLKVDGGAVTNSKDLVFPVARDDWGEVVSIAIVDDSGSVIYKEELRESQVIVIGQKLRIPVDKMVIRFVDKT